MSKKKLIEKSKETPEDIFIKFLRTQKLSVTQERLRVLDCIYKIEGHFDIDALLSRLSAQGKDRRATIYRTIKLLMEAGLIARVRSQPGGRVVYEHTFGHTHHDHLVCARCDRIIEFQDSIIEQQQNSIAEKHGFELLHHSMMLTGICPDCLKRDSV